MRQAVILAGGMGTRLKAITGDLPKPLAPADGKPLLERQLELLALSGVGDVVVLCSYRADAIREFCGDGSRWGLSVTCIEEERARGTAGAVLDALPHLADSFFVLYGDTVLDVDLPTMARAHEAANPDATLLVHPNDHPADSDIVEVDAAGTVLAIHGYPHPPGKDLPNLVNAGLYILEKRALAALDQTDTLPEKPDFGKHVFARMLDQGMRLLGYRSPEYIKDAGTPERLEKTGKDLRTGRVAALSLRTPSPAVFIDRDGVINEERSYISHPDQVVLIDGAAEALRLLNRSHFRTVIITNQPVVARGEATEAELQQVHNRLDTLLGAQGAYVDALYFCPHHPDKGFAGERADLKIVCDCRKPARGMIDKAAADLNIDIAASWYIGDMTTDIELARRCGMNSVLVETGFGGRDGKYDAQPTFIAPSLREAVALILDRVA